MEKPWLYFKVEFELVKDWQLYSWKLLMESIAGTSWAGRRETSMLDKQLKGLISGVTHPWSIFKGREIFVIINLGDRTEPSRISQGLYIQPGLSSPSFWEIVSDPSTCETSNG